MYKLIIAGGRDFEDYSYLCSELDKLLATVKDEIVIVSGRARGADALGERYANEHGYSINYYPANWKVYGKTAGFRRNEQMAQVANALAAFWDGTSHGTADMIERANRHGLKVDIFRYPKFMSK